MQVTVTGLDWGMDQEKEGKGGGIQKGAHLGDFKLG
jgi:hypothetical protein